MDFPLKKKQRPLIIFFFLFLGFSFLSSQVFFNYGRAHLFPFSHWNFFSTPPKHYQDYSILIHTKDNQKQVLCFFEGCEVLKYQKINKNRYHLYYLIQYLGKKTEGELFEIRDRVELKKQINSFLDELPFIQSAYLVKTIYFPPQYLKEKRLIKYEILQQI